MRRLLPALALLAALTGCNGGDPTADPATDSAADQATSPSTPSSTAESPSTSPPTATPVPKPPQAACYQLSYDAAVAPTADQRPVSCRARHTSMTFAVGPLHAVVDGHLLAVDSRRVQEQVATECPKKLADFIGGSLADRRLSMLRAVWFTPTVEQSDAGASWYRCDVIAVASTDTLAPLTGPLKGVLDTQEGRDRYGICGTAEPGTPGFSRVVCSEQHSWRAIATVPFRDGPYPGESTVRDAGQQTCQDAARNIAADTLNFQWGYEWPTAEQWRSGQSYGLCWAPD